MGSTLVEHLPENQIAYLISQLRRDVDALKSNQVKRLVFPDTVTNRILIDGLSGVIEVSVPGFDVTTGLSNSEILFSTNFGVIPETLYSLTPGPAQTTSSSFAFPSILSLGNTVTLLINLPDWKDMLFYFEANFAGTANARCEAQLYNVTTSAAIAGSVIDSNQNTNIVRVRSSAITLTAGSNEYAVQYKRSGGTGADTVTLVEAHLVARIYA